jgi:hypothetical protein
VQVDPLLPDRSADQNLGKKRAVEAGEHTLAAVRIRRPIDEDGEAGLVSHSCRLIDRVSRLARDEHAPISGLQILDEDRQSIRSAFLLSWQRSKVALDEEVPPPLLVEFAALG